MNFFKFFVMTFCTHGSHAILWNCFYKNFPIALNNMYQNFNIFDYACLLNKTQNLSQEDFEISGQHQANKTDDDVKILNILNNLDIFPQIFCEKFKNLETIFIQNAEVHAFAIDSLENCRNLKVFHIGANKIHKLPENFFAKSATLIKIRIVGNQLKLYENQFQNQNQLDQLILSSNQLITVPDRTFQSLYNLQQLLLNLNKIQVLNQEWFVNLTKLTYLDMRDNFISVLPDGIFKPLKSLKFLWLGHNKINVLKPDCFEGLRNLNHLHLFTNEIRRLPYKIFEPLVNLQTLSLADNSLKTIDSKSFGIHYYLKFIHLGTNKINAIDEALLNVTPVEYLDLRDNLCSNEIVVKRDKLATCLENFKTKNVKKTQVQNEIQTCGRAVAAQGAIIGGTQIARGSFPWIAALEYINGMYLCGGTVVSSKKVVTAAHCIQIKYAIKHLLPRELLVLLGIHDLNIRSEVGRSVFAVDRIHMHPDWNPFTRKYDADIAVLVLEQEIIFGQFIQPICLVDAGSIVVYINDSVVVGYGRSDPKNLMNENIPKIIETPIQDNVHCFLSNYKQALYSSHRTFCGGNGDGTGICNGDSGSGSMVYFNGAYYLRGIVSAAQLTERNECDVENYSLFTDVLKFVDWIMNV